jgi:hypothetical protein
MRKLSCKSIFVVAFFALSAGGAGAYTPSMVAINDALSGTPSYTGAADISSKSKAKNHGAKKRGFCPPGQAKKPGRGSAFNC